MTLLRFVMRFARAGALLLFALLVCGEPISERASAENAQPMLSVTDSPPKADVPGVQWMTVTAPGVGVMSAAVARPEGAGPFPALIILHGSHGFAEQYVRLAQSLARAGVLGVAACWFSGGRGAGVPFITPIECAEAPPMSDASSAVAQKTVDALVQAVRSLPEVRADRMALFGHSRGGGAALNYILQANSVRVAVLNSAGYPAELAERADEVKVPILILHGAADTPTEGGSPMTDVQMARNFEAALRRAGKQVEAVYHEGGHNAIFTLATQYDDAVRRMTAFLRRHLFD